MRRLWSDAGYLRHAQYGDGGNLAARQAIYAWQEPRLDLVALVLDSLSLEGDETIIDVGCGNGRYLAALFERRHGGITAGVDFSPGMLASGRRGVTSIPLVCGDAGRLPLRDGAAKVVICAHMLYHLPDPAAGVSELRRVTYRAGRAAVVLNGSDHLAEMRRADRRVRLERGASATTAASDRLDLDQGEALLTRFFSNVRRHDFIAELVVEERDAVARYLRSSVSTAGLPESEAFVRDVTTLLFTDGPARIRTHAGVLIGTGAIGGT